MSIVRGPCGVLFRKPSVQTKGFLYALVWRVRMIDLDSGSATGNSAPVVVLELWAPSSGRPGIRATREQPQDPLGRQFEAPNQVVQCVASRLRPQHVRSTAGLAVVRRDVEVTEEEVDVGTTARLGVWCIAHVPEDAGVGVLIIPRPARGDQRA